MRKTITETLIVKSEPISVVTYEKKNKQLSIEFRNGRIYIYKNVPLKIYDRLRTSKSIGKYFNSIIKNNYSYTTNIDYPNFK